MAMLHSYIQEQCLFLNKIIVSFLHLEYKIYAKCTFIYYTLKTNCPEFWETFLNLLCLTSLKFVHILDVFLLLTISIFEFLIVSRKWSKIVMQYVWASTSYLHPIPGLGEGNDNPLQRRCLENLMDGGAW